MLLVEQQTFFSRNFYLILFIVDYRVKSAKHAFYNTLKTFNGIF